MIELRLDLANHCIETELKRQYNRALSEYFGKRDDQEHLATLIGMTKQALESLDFPELRKTYPVLSGHSRADVLLINDADRLELKFLQGESLQCIAIRRAV